MIKEYIKKYSKASIITSVIMIVASVLLIVFPKTMLNIVVYVISGALFVDGLIHFVTYFALTHEMRIFSNDLLEGILALLAGVFVAFNADAFIGALTMIIGLWVVIKGLLNLQLSFQLQQIIEFNWFWIFLCAVLSVVLGVFIIVHPIDMAIGLTMAEGIVLLVTEVLSLIQTIYVLSSIILKCLDHILIKKYHYGTFLIKEKTC